MKYARLTKEQLEELHPEFINFLATQSIDKKEWDEYARLVDEEEVIEDYSDTDRGIQYFKTKYKLDKYIGVFYRGNDKRLETLTPSYDVFINKTKEIRALHPELPILLMPDECAFKWEFKKHFDNVICFDEMPCIDNPNSSVSFEIPLKDRPHYGAMYNAAISLLAESEHLITHSGNGGLWACFYRGNADNVHQCFNNNFYERL
jgi:hypothetical protein